ncbi:hypothetical protein B0T25DRAFT_606607 [Lasiosphaeria hispida]|uniref:NWD NACHT-NTPase N-terminal domain-containing protein n=1 Tax=Lasiosphaeria hispida TaxID=260671 RepID=A0AAJ0HHA5_9PEZI|nr:hypothetical protein B0T25DRAFT_606607 [Lasiosphaeria hispida]
MGKLHFETAQSIDSGRVVNWWCELGYVGDDGTRWAFQQSTSILIRKAWAPRGGDYCLPGTGSVGTLQGHPQMVVRMDWYCALTEHLLNKDNIVAGNEFQAILHRLEETLVELYKALLLYQMKSACSYFHNQGLVANEVVLLLEFLYKLVGGLLSHDAGNQHVPPSLLRSIATVEWSGEK